MEFDKLADFITAHYKKYYEDEKEGNCCIHYPESCNLQPTIKERVTSFSTL